MIFRVFIRYEDGVRREFLISEEHLAIGALLFLERDRKPLSLDFPVSDLEQWHDWRITDLLWTPAEHTIFIQAKKEDG